MTSIVGSRQAPINQRVRKHTLRNRHKRLSLNTYLATRSWIVHKNIDLVNLARNHQPFLNRMMFMKKLPVHEGCVNNICWNKTGEYILSGSDDCNLCITKPTNLFDSSPDYTVLHKIPTRHLGNIFGAQFIPNTGDQQIVSCSSEGPVIVHDINSTDPSEGILNFNCHSSTIYDVVTVPDDDKTFLSCGEDKTIRLFDMRVHNSCARSGTCPHPALVRNSHAMTTLDLHPLNPNLMLIGRADGLGLVYDRRKLPDVTKFSRERAHSDRLAGISSQEYRFKHPLDGVVAQFTVPDMDEKCRFTSLCYNKDGNEVLGSYSGDYVYLFSHDKSSNIELVQTLPRNVAKESGSAGYSDNDGGRNLTSTNTETQNGGVRRRRGTKISRIRVRGDWSDTGVNSVPLTSRGNTQSDEDNDERTPAGARSATFSNHIAVTIGSRNLGERSRFVNNIEIIAGPIDYNASRNDTPGESRARQSERTIEEEDENGDNEDIEDEGDNEVDDDDDDEDDDDDDDDEEDENSTVGDDDEYDAQSDDDDYVRFAKITVENSLNEAQEHHARYLDDNNLSNKMETEDEDIDDEDNQSSSDKSINEHKSKISTKTRAKFRKTLNDLKNKYNHIPAYKPRVKYQGHRNSRTSIKEAIFWGDDYVMSGSDCGRIMVWEKESAKIVMGFPADERVVNCLAPNPRHYVLASSGIDYDIKLWSTQSLREGPLKLSDEEMKKIVDNNELMLEESKHTISVPPHLFFRVLASLVRSSR